MVVHVTPAPPPPPPGNNPPSAAFTFLPMGPLVGEGVMFTGGSRLPDGDPITRTSNFGDLTPASSDVAPAHSYGLAATYTVSLSVSDDRGGFASTSQRAHGRPQPSSTPPAEQGGAPIADQPGGPAVPGQKPAPVRMRPFPVVRIAGIVLPDGALVEDPLGARAARGERARPVPRSGLPGSRGCALERLLARAPRPLRAEAARRRHARAVRPQARAGSASTPASDPRRQAARARRPVPHAGKQPAGAVPMSGRLRVATAAAAAFAASFVVAGVAAGGDSGSAPRAPERRPSR